MAIDTKTIDQFAVVGQRVPKLEGPEKVTGAATYTVDVRLPGMLECRVLRSPIPHALVKHVDTSRALRVPGVRAIITHDDVPHKEFNPSFRVPNDLKTMPLDEMVIDDRVRYIGDKVAAIAAASWEAAEEAKELIRVDYEPLPAVFDPEEAMQPGAPEIHAIRPGNVAKEFHYSFLGDVEQGFKEAAHIFEGRYVTPGQAHCAMEPHSAVAVWDQRGRLTVWSSTQVHFNVRMMLAHIFELPMTKIRVIKPHVGGGFGGKDELFDEPIAAILAKKTGRPVRLEMDREEVFAASRMRHPAVIYLKQGIDRNGILVARYLRVITNTGAYAAAGPRITAASGIRWGMLYRAPHVGYDGYCVYTNCFPSGAFRGYGNPQSTYANETQMDEIADALGLDPVELRLRNHIRKGDINPSTGWVIGSCGLSECLERGAAEIGWSDWPARKQQLEAANPGKKYGLGVACALHNTGPRPFIDEVSSAIVKLNDDGTVHLLTGTAECGQGSDTVLAQICAEELGVPFEDVYLVTGDTDSTPFDLGAYASRTTHIGGNAVRLATQQVKQKLLEVAGGLLEAAPEDLEIRDRRIHVKGAPDRSLTLKEVVLGAQFSKNPTANQVLVGEASYSPPTNAPPFQAQFAQVEVDTDTGQVRVLKAVAAVDVGRAINPAGVEGQMNGSIHMGAGWALHEEVDVDMKTGKVQNPNFVDYRMGTIADTPPEVKIIIVEDHEPTGPFGAKGVAEVGMVATAPAVGNAVHDAIGIRFHHLPMKPERVLAALEAGVQKTPDWAETKVEVEGGKTNVVKY